MENDENEVTPLEFLEAVYINPNLPLSTRLRAAIEAAPYKHPKLTAVAHAHFQGMILHRSLNVPSPEVVAKLLRC